MSGAASTGADEQHDGGSRWGIAAQASGSAGALASHGKFWAQKVHLRALQGSASNFSEQRKRVLQAIAAICVLQVRLVHVALESC